MNLEEIKEKHSLITKKIEKLDFGRVYLEFMTEMPKKGYEWIQKFLIKYGYDLEDKEKKHNVVFKFDNKTKKWYVEFEVSK